MDESAAVQDEIANRTFDGDEDYDASNSQSLNQYLLESTVKDYASLFKVDTSKQVEELELLIDGLLAKLEEYCTIIESIRNESKDALFTTLPVLHERCQQLKPVFQKIDKLESFIAVVQISINDADEKVTVAEKELGNKNLKKLLRSVPVPKFLVGKKELKPYLKQEVHAYDYKAPVTFKTDDYFEKLQRKNDTSDI